MRRSIINRNIVFFRSFFYKNIRNISVILLFVIPFTGSINSAYSKDTIRELTVFAAASMVSVIDEIGIAYEQAYGTRIKSVFAASSRLARQIEAGAPAHVFISANLQWMDYLESHELIKPNSRVNFARNVLVIIKPSDRVKTPKQVDKTNIQRETNIVVPYLDPNFKLLMRLKNRRLAIGDPDFVPVGYYAKAALQHLYMWEKLLKRIAPMPNVRAVLSVVERAEAPMGIVYNSDAVSSKKVEILAKIKPDSHPEILYPAAVVFGAPPEADNFVAFLMKPEVQRILGANGFVSESMKSF